MRIQMQRLTKEQIMNKNSGARHTGCLDGKGVLTRIHATAQAGHALLVVALLAGIIFSGVLMGSCTAQNQGGAAKPAGVDGQGSMAGEGDNVMTQDDQQNDQTLPTGVMVAKDDMSGDEPSDVPSDMPSDMPGKADGVLAKDAVMEWTGPRLAGTLSPYLAFTQQDYALAKESGKIILLYFYADWCPSCIAEQPRAHAAFDALNDPSIVGFRVNYRDAGTDDAEAGLAKEFGITVQHTKVILKGDDRLLKSLESWDRQRYLDELQKAKDGSTASE
jgi:thiol-disulfide isomerase/thioredoxin